MTKSSPPPSEFASHNISLFDQNICLEFRSLLEQGIVEAKIVQDRRVLWPTGEQAGQLSFEKTDFDFQLLDEEEIEGSFALVKAGEHSIRVHTLLFSNSGHTKHFEGFIGHLIYDFGPAPAPGPQPGPLPGPLPIHRSDNPFPKVLLKNQEFKDLFHFTGLHQPSRIPHASYDRFIDIFSLSPFQQSLVEAAHENDSEEMKALSEAYQETEEFKVLKKFLEEFTFSLIQTHEWLSSIVELPPSEAIWKCLCQWNLAMKEEEELLPWLLVNQQIAKDGYLALLICSLTEAPQIELITQLTLWLRLLEFFVRCFQDLGLGAILLALEAILVLPETLFSVLLPTTEKEEESPVTPLGIADLMLVREYTSHYELGSIAHIENVMPRSQKTHSRKEGERIQDFRSERTHQEQLDNGFESVSRGHGLSNSNPVAHKKTFAYDDENGLLKEFENESTKSLERFTGGWSLLFDPEENSLSQALRYVRDRLAQFERVQNQEVSRHRALKHAVEWEALEQTVIDNQSQNLPLRGIYHWVNRIKQNELINLGHRLLLRINVNQPGQDLLSPPVIGQLPQGLEELLTEVEGFRQLDRKKYLRYASSLGIQELLLPPVPEKNISILLTDAPPLQQQQVALPEGYRAVSATISIVYDGNQVSGTIGQSTFDQSRFTCSGGEAAKIDFPEPPPLNPENLVACQLNDPPLELNHEMGQLPVSILSNANCLQSTISIQTELTPISFETWQFQASLQLRRTHAHCQSDPQWKRRRQVLYAEQKQFQHETLKKRSLQAIFNEMKCNAPIFQHYFNLPEAVAAFNWKDLYFAFRVSKEDAGEPVPEEPEEDTRGLSEKKQNTRSDKTNWFDGNQDHPHLNEFLHADLAKVLVTVKKGYELPVLYAIWSKGNAWRGLKSDAPILDNQRFFADDLLFPEPSNERMKIRHSWEVTEPTAMIYLQDSAGGNVELPCPPNLPHSHTQRNPFP